MRGTGRKSVLLAGALGISLMGMAQQRPASAPRFSSFELAGTYSAERSKVAGTSDYFWLHGGSVEAAVNSSHGWGGVVNVTGQRASSYKPGLDLCEFTFMGGPRYTFRNVGRLAHDNHTVSIFLEGLAGTVHGYNSVFPATSGVTPSANAWALQAGGGIDVRLRGGLALRMLELDYVATTLPNNYNNFQHHFRMAIGLAYEVRKGH